MKLQSIERVREQYFDTEIGELVWVTSEEAASGRIAYGELIPLPEPNSVVGPVFRVPYVRASDRRLLNEILGEVPPDETLAHRVAVFEKGTLLAGPYFIRVWRKA